MPNFGPSKAGRPPCCLGQHPPRCRGVCRFCPFFSLLFFWVGGRVGGWVGCVCVFFAFLCVCFCVCACFCACACAGVCAICPRNCTCIIYNVAGTVFLVCAELNVGMQSEQVEPLLGSAMRGSQQKPATNQVEDVQWVKRLR